MDENLASNSMSLKHHHHLYFSHEVQALKRVMGVCCANENHVIVLWEDEDVVHVLPFLGGLVQLAKGEDEEAAGILLDNEAVRVLYSDAQNEEAGMFHQVRGRMSDLFGFFPKVYSTKIQKTYKTTLEMRVFLTEPYLKSSF